MKTTIEKIVFFLMALCPVVLGAHDHVPANLDNITEFEGNARIFLKKDQLNGLAEFKGQWQDEKQAFRYRSLTLGPYYRLLKNLKVGGFYRIQAGARHEDDWIVENGKWFWRDSRNRTEHLAMIDVRPRFLFDFLPGKKWVFEVKNRYEYNFFNDQQTIIVRPGLTYFWFRDGAPFMNLFIQLEGWVPLNWHEDSLVWESWIYAGFLYHVTESFKAGASIAYRKTAWSASKRFKEVFNSNYGADGKESSIFIGFNLIYRIDL